MYWVAAGSMRVFGVHAWADRHRRSRIHLALLLATYALGLRLFAGISPPGRPDRGALYSALALATCTGPYPLHALLHPRHRSSAVDDPRRVGLPHRARTDRTANAGAPRLAFETWVVFQSKVGPSPLPRLRLRHRAQPPHQRIHRPRLPHRLRPALSGDHTAASNARALPSHPIDGRVLCDRSAVAYSRRAAQPSHRAALRPWPACARRDGNGSISTTNTLPASSRAAFRTITARSPSPSSRLLAAIGSSPGPPSFPEQSPVTSATSAHGGRFDLGPRSCAHSGPLGQPDPWILHPLRPPGVLFAAAPCLRSR